MPEPAPMFVSTIIPTIGRPTLTRAVASVLQQSYDVAPIEVIVVNDSGAALTPEPWHADRRVRIVTTNRVERSVARNTGAHAATGRYLHFLDDDDELVDGALQAFWALATEAPTACWLYGAYDTVDNEGTLVNRFVPHLRENTLAALVASEGLPLQASLVRSDAFDRIGGFDPTLVGTEDRDLGRRLAATGVVARTDALVARIRVGREGSTTNWDSLATTDRAGREKLLRLPGIRARILASARSPYWQGRVARAYLGSAAWNCRRGRLGTTAWRLIGCVTGSLPHAYATAFWRGIAGLRPDEPILSWPVRRAVCRR